MYIYIPRDFDQTRFFRLFSNSPKQAKVGVYVFYWSIEEGLCTSSSVLVENSGLQMDLKIAPGGPPEGVLWAISAHFEHDET
jgi:hypothetical protein